MTLWVFGYGSLLWDPGFEVAEAVKARLDGYHRSFCMSSIHHRGSEENPGLVLALDAAKASCHGLALAVAGGTEERALADLRERELISSAYLEKSVTLMLEDGRQVSALAYVIDPEHRQYRGALPLETQARIIARATGGRGPNSEYLFRTARQLHDLDLADADLDWLVARVDTLLKHG
jgi:cation transport protein ChaC